MHDLPSTCRCYESAPEESEDMAWYMPNESVRKAVAAENDWELTVFLPSIASEAQMAKSPRRMVLKG